MVKRPAFLFFISLHAVRLELLRLVLTERGRRSPGRRRRKRLLDVTVAGRGDVTCGGWWGSVWVLIVSRGGSSGGGSGVLRVGCAGVIQVWRGCGRRRGRGWLDVRDHDAGLHECLRVHIVSRNPEGQRDTGIKRGTRKAFCAQQLHFNRETAQCTKGLFT